MSPCQRINPLTVRLNLSPLVTQVAYCPETSNDQHTNHSFTKTNTKKILRLPRTERNTDSCSGYFGQRVSSVRTIPLIVWRLNPRTNQPTFTMTRKSRPEFTNRYTIYSLRHSKPKQHLFPRSLLRTVGPFAVVVCSKLLMESQSIWWNTQRKGDSIQRCKPIYVKMPADLCRNVYRLFDIWLFDADFWQLLCWETLSIYHRIPVQIHCL